MVSNTIFCESMACLDIWGSSTNYWDFDSLILCRNTSNNTRKVPNPLKHISLGNLRISNLANVGNMCSHYFWNCVSWKLEMSPHLSFRSFKFGNFGTSKVLKCWNIGNLIVWICWNKFGKMGTDRSWRSIFFF